MSDTLSKVRCFQHVSREAAARCPECERFFCRECVTEHDGRMVCRPCLSVLADSDDTHESGLFHQLVGWLCALLGFAFVVSLFYLLGRLLLSIPSEFHQGNFFE